MTPPRTASPARLYEQGIRAYQRGDAARALGYLEALLVHPRAEPVDRLDALAALARAHYQLDHAEEAVATADRLGKEARALGHLDGEADARVFAGQIHLEYGGLNLAEDALRAVVAHAPRGSSPLYRANAWFLLGKVAFEGSRYGEARLALDRAARIYRRLRRPAGLADVEIVRGHLALARGAFSQALAAARRARRLFARVGDAYGKAGAWHLEGEAYQVLRKPTAAARVLRQAAATFRRLQDPTNVAAMLTQLGDLLVSIGAYDAAEQALDEAVLVLRNLAKPLRLGPALLALAHTRQARGRVLDALALQEEATGMLEAAGADPVDRALALRARAQTLLQLGRLGDARTLLTRGLELLHDLPQEVEVANAHLELARIAEREGEDLAGVEVHLDPARTIFERRRLWQSLTQVELVHARVLAIHGEFEAALHVAGHAAQRASRTHDPHGAADAYGLRAAMFARLGRRRAAEADMARAQTRLGAMGTTWNLAAMDVDLASQHLAAGDLPAAWAAALRALAQIEAVRAGVAEAPSVHADLVEAFRIGHRTVLTMLRTQGEPVPFIERVEALRDVTRLAARSTQERPASARGSSHLRIVPPERVQPNAVRRLLDGARAAARLGVVTIAWYPELHAGERDVLVITPNQGTWFATLAEPAGFLPSVLTDLLDDPGALSLAGWNERLDRLSRVLLDAPFLRAVPIGSRRGVAPRSLGALLHEHQGAVLDFVPHGWTGLVPWAALPIDRGGSTRRERLGERHILRLRSRLPEQPAERRVVRPPRRALVFGDDGRALPAARAEARAVAQKLRSAGVEVVEYGRERPLTLSELRAEMARVDLLHLATHAEFNAASAWRSFVQLSRAEPGAPTGDLSLEMLLDFEAAPREVVLAACSTVAVDRARLFDALSLAHGFLHAGSQVVVGTLWHVNDAAAANLMDRVYTHRLNADDPAGFDVAVARAVRETLGHSGALSQGEVSQTKSSVRGMLNSAAQQVRRPNATPATWAALQVLLAPGA